MKVTKFIRKSGVLVGVAVLASGVTFYLTSSLYDDQVEDLQDQVSELEQAELHARVTQRVSEQLEDIAKEQTIISDRERDRAEKQTKIAEEEKSKAEHEKGLAQVAQRRALASANEAEKARKLAEAQTKLATENMLIAQQARAHADTLLYSSLANSLALSAITQAQVGKMELASMLSFTAWRFDRSYESDDAIRANIYRALLTSSGSLHMGANSLLGNVRRVHECGGYTLGVTDYGELYYADAGGYKVVSMGGSYDFRDFVSRGIKENWVLCADGRLLQIDMTGIENGAPAASMKVEVVMTLPPDTWLKLVETKDGFAVMGSKTVAWVKNGKYAGSQQMDEQLTAIGMQDDCLHVFGRNGAHYVSTKPGVLADMELTSMKKRVPVTAYLFDSSRGYHILGLYDGRILIYDTDGKRLAELLGHIAPITDLHIWNYLLGSTSYDSTMRLWGIESIGSMVTPVEVTLTSWPLCFDVNSKTGEVWVGTEKGNVPHFCSYMEENAEATGNKLTRDFTPAEWNYYVGAGIPQISIIKKGGAE